MNMHKLIGCEKQKIIFENKDWIIGRTRVTMFHWSWFVFWFPVYLFTGTLNIPNKH